MKIIGIDEVGYGAWAGPVCSVAVLFKERIDECLMSKFVDSKSISKAQREAIMIELQSKVSYSVGMAEPAEIDLMNIKNANHLAMQRAFEGLYAKNTDILCDGNFRILIDGNSHPTFSEHIENIIKGDQIVKEISCASIIAKVTRDSKMAELHQLFPCYNWVKNVGYGTREHMKAIKLHGVTKYHRVSYKPLRHLNQLEICDIMKV